MKMKLFGIAFGTLKAIADRAMNYMSRAVTLINFILLINITSLLGTDMMQYAPLAVIGIIAGIILMVFDILIVLPQENDFITRNNPVLVAMQKDLKDIKELMKR